MSWLIVAILAYLIFAIVYLIDKYLLGGPIPSPKVYAFYVGTLGILVLILAPFVGFYIPEIKQIILSLIAGAIFIYALFWFYKALQKYEASRVVPAIGGLVPFFTFGLFYIFSKGKEILTFQEIIAFFLLVLGSIFIVLEKEKLITLGSLRISALAAFLLSLSFVLTKYVYLTQPFWSGFIWMRVGGFLIGLCFFFFVKDVREEIFKKKVSLKKKTMGIFISNQAAGAGANILQSWAIFLTPAIVYVAIINALQGIQYVFLLIFTVLLSLTQPLWAKGAGLKEETSKKILSQKIFAILLIGTGLTLLAL